MSTFKRDMVITVDGEPLKCQSKAIDFTNAEQALARDGGKVDTNPLALRFRIAFAVLKRCHAGHPAASAYGVFLDQLDDLDDDTDAEEGGALDPTPPADSDGSPWRSPAKPE